MDVLGFLLSNGRNAGVRGNRIPNTLAISSVCASPSSTENSQNNAWNVNFSDGNTNNNNKYNSNAIRPVAALDEETKIGWLTAYHDCCKAKKSSYNCNLYRLDFERDLWQLVAEIYTHTYRPTTSICFIVTRPRLREVFAANFRDRIVQHWICLRLEPLFENRFKALGDRSHNCRKGYGTSSAIRALQRDIEKVTQNYTHPAWIGKMDVRSFFMSIDTHVLWDKLLLPFIEAEYHEQDKDLLIELTHITLMHRPQEDCERKSPIEMWRNLEPHKSLFNNPEGIGLAIGNITSQLKANFYMSFYIEEILPLCARLGIEIEEFVDDFAVVAEEKDAILELRRETKRILWEKLHLHLHEDKFYIQPAKHGVKFVGQVIKPHRNYISNSTVAGFVDELRRTERLCIRMERGQIDATSLKLLQHHISAINSYLGFMAHTASYKLRRRLFEKHCRALWQFCYTTKAFAIAKVKTRYDYKIHLLTQEINNYGMDLHSDRAKPGRNPNRTRNGAGNAQLQHPADRRRRAQVSPPKGNS